MGPGGISHDIPGARYGFALSYDRTAPKLLRGQFRTSRASATLRAIAATCGGR